MRSFLFIFLAGVMAKAEDQSCRLSHGPESLKQVATFISQPYIEICDDLHKIEAGNEPQNKPLCSVFWPNHKAPFEQILKSNPESLNKWSADVKNPSQVEMAASGQKLGSLEEMGQIEKKYFEYRDKLKTECCHNDSTCIQAFQKIPLEFCKSPDDPKVPDPCAYQGTGTFSMNEEEQIQTWMNLNSLTTSPTPFDLQAKTYLTQHPELATKRGKIAFGHISMSRYFHLTSPNLPYLFQHELGHACSVIQRQIASLKSQTIDKQGEVNAFSMSLYCQNIQPKYANLSIINQFEEKKVSSRIEKCIMDRIRNETLNPDDHAYAAKSCFGAKIEEATADIFAAYSSVNGILDTLPFHCSNYPDPIHIGGFSVVECLSLHSAKYRAQVKTGIQCK
jgi:hypothetical protein